MAEKHISNFVLERVTKDLQSISKNLDAQAKVDVVVFTKFVTTLLKLAMDLTKGVGNYGISSPSGTSGDSAGSCDEK